MKSYSALASEFRSLIDSLPIPASYDPFAVPDLNGCTTRTARNTPVNNLTTFFLRHMEIAWNDVSQTVSQAESDSFTPHQSIRSCLADTVRTRFFVNAVQNAVRQKEQTLLSGATIEVCDAGTGAFALLAVAAALASKRVHVTALEINAHSVDVASSIIRNMGLQDQITVKESNARNSVLDIPPDILVSETMNSALFEEPLVQIMSNLEPQTKPGAIILPTQVDIHGALGPWGDKNVSSLVAAAITWPRLYTYSPGTPTEKIAVSLSPGQGELYGPYAGLFSRVRVGDQWLEPGVSALSQVRFVQLWGQAAACTLSYPPGQQLIDIRSNLGSFARITYNSP